MPVEIRRIIFTPEELIQAVARHRRDEKQPFPSSRARGAKIENGTDGEPRISILLDVEGESVALRATEVAVALIKYCHLRKIPLPRRASKALAAEQGRIALVLHLEDR